MSAFECWQNQRERLRAALSEGAESSGATYLVRHALSQVEQDTLAEMTDDTLRQQAGVLFSCLKSSAAFLDVSVSATQWQALSLQKPKRKPFWLFLVAAGVLQILLGLHFYSKGETVTWILLLAAAALACLYPLLRGKPKTDLSAEETRVTLRPDTEKLLSVIDAQLRAMDRYLGDLQYLNEALGKQAGQPAARVAGAASELLETLYDMDEDTKAQALPAASKVLRDLGMELIDYSDADKRLFSVLPSKQETRTLAPALVSASDRRLLRRGTAAVCEGKQP